MISPTALFQPQDLLRIFYPPLKSLFFFLLWPIGPRSSTVFFLSFPLTPVSLFLFLSSFFFHLLLFFEFFSLSGPSTQTPAVPSWKTFSMSVVNYIRFPLRGEFTMWSEPSLIGHLLSRGLQPTSSTSLLSTTTTSLSLSFLRQYKRAISPYLYFHSLNQLQARLDF